MAKASPSPSSQRKFVVPRFQSVHEHVSSSFFSGGTFINHLILWNKKQPAHSTALYLNLWVRAGGSECIASNANANFTGVHRRLIWSISILWPLLCIAKYYTTAINFLIFSSKKVIFIQHEWDRWRWLLNVGCWIGVLLFFASLCALCSALFGLFSSLLFLRHCCFYFQLNRCI